MHVFPCFKFSSKITLHDMPVFSNSFAINGDVIIYSCSALTSPCHKWTDISCFFCIFRIGNRCASARAIKGCRNSIFRNIKRCGANLANFCYSIFSFFSSLFPKSFCNIKSHTTSTAKFLRIAPRKKFFIAMRTSFNFHSMKHSNRSQ